MFEKYNIKEIRILPASSKLEFETEEDIREYLRHELPKVNGGEYWYREYGIEIDKKLDILILFWHSGKAVGCGILHDREKFEEKRGDYKGRLFFYPETIFNISGITEDEIHKYSDIPKSVRQGSPKVDIKAKDEILKLIYEKWKDYN